MAEAAVQTNVSYLQVADFKLDGGTQPRAEIDESIVFEYAEAMKSGESFPPVVAFQDGASVWLADGFHRVHAARRAGIKEIAAEVYDGTKRDAILHSVGANAAHGLRRTNADKHKAVMTLLHDDEWSGWTNREIARHCAVSHSMVNDLRASLEDSSSEKPAKRSYKTKHGTTATMNTENIGRRKESPKPPAEPVPEPESPKPRGVGLRYAHDAIALLDQIPQDDGLRDEALDTVISWIKANR